MGSNRGTSNIFECLRLDVAVLLGPAATSGSTQRTLFSEHGSQVLELRLGLGANIIFSHSSAPFFHTSIYYGEIAAMKQGCPRNPK